MIVVKDDEIYASLQDILVGVAGKILKRRSVSMGAW
jgi:hypothetical protein